MTSLAEKIIAQLRVRDSRLASMRNDHAEKNAAYEKALQDEAQWRSLIAASTAARKQMEAERTELVGRIKDHEEVDAFLLEHVEASKIESETVTGAFGVKRDVKIAVKKE